MTKDSEWITRRFGEWARGFRSVERIRWSGAVSDDALSWIAVLSEVQVLFCGGHADEPITSRGVASLKELSNLCYLSLRVSGLDDDRLAEYFATMPPLGIVDCSVGPRSLEAIARIPSIVHLSCDSADIKDADFRHLEPMSNLRTLNLRTIPVGRHAVEWLTQSARLQHLRITDCAINDGDLERISQLSELTHLSIETCGIISDAGIAHLSKLPQLQHLTLPSEAFTPATVEALRAIPSLTHVHAYGEITDPELRIVLEQGWDYSETPRLLWDE